VLLFSQIHGSETVFEQTAAARFTNIGVAALLQGFAFSFPKKITMGQIFDAFVKPAEAAAARRVRQTGILFTLAHELAHAICGHLEDDGAF